MALRKFLIEKATIRNGRTKWLGVEAVEHQNSIDAVKDFVHRYLDYCTPRCRLRDADSDETLCLFDLRRHRAKEK